MPQVTPGSEAPEPSVGSAPPEPAPPGERVWLCPTCATANPPTFVYCRNCGQLLPHLTQADPPPPEPTALSPQGRFRESVLPISIELIAASRATQFDSSAIRKALVTVEASLDRLQRIAEETPSERADEFVWERDPEMAESSSLIEAAGALLAMAAAPETSESLRRLFLRRAYWVLRAADERTRVLLEKDGR